MRCSVPGRNQAQNRAVGRCLRSSDRKREREKGEKESCQREFSSVKSQRMSEHIGLDRLPLSPSPPSSLSSPRETPIQPLRRGDAVFQSTCVVRIPSRRRFDATTRPCGVVGSARALLPRASFRAA